jgi:ABC-type spermidine/putrescine transport system permease subunit I
MKGIPTFSKQHRNNRHGQNTKHMLKTFCASQETAVVVVVVVVVVAIPIAVVVVGGGTYR